MHVVPAYACAISFHPCGCLGDRVEGSVLYPNSALERTPMANTKNITDRTERKAAKRAQRKSLKQAHLELSPKDRKKFRKSEQNGIRAFIVEQNAGE